MPDEDAYLTDHGRSRAHSGGPRWVSHIGARHRRAPMCLRVQPRASYRRHQRRFANRPYAVHGNRVDGRNDHTLPNVEGKNNRHYLQPANANRVEPKPVVGLPGSAAGCPGGITPHGRPTGSPIRCAARTAAGLAYAAPKCTAVSGRRTASPLHCRWGAASCEPRAFSFVWYRGTAPPCPYPNAHGAGGA